MPNGMTSLMVLRRDGMLSGLILNELLRKVSAGTEHKLAYLKKAMTNMSTVYAK